MDRNPGTTYHGRNDGRHPTQTGWVVLGTTDRAAAESYADGPDGVLYRIIVSGECADAAVEAERWAADLVADALAGVIPSDALEQAILRRIEDDGEAAVVAALAADFRPTNIVASAGAYDDHSLVSWLWERYGIDVVATEDGVAVLDPFAVGFEEVR